MGGMTFTDKQRQAVEALEGAQREGLKLTAYARARGLPIRELYDAIAGLRRKGSLPKPARKSTSKFVAVRVVQAGAATTATVRASSSAATVCRITHAGLVIECTQWPSPSWIAALSSGTADAPA